MEVRTQSQRHILSSTSTDSSQPFTTAANLAKAQTATSVLFDSDLSRLEPDVVLSAFDGDKRLVKLANDDLGQPLSRLAVQSKLVKSRGQ